MPIRQRARPRPESAPRGQTAGSDPEGRRSSWRGFPVSISAPRKNSEPNGIRHHFPRATNGKNDRDSRFSPDSPEKIWTDVRQRIARAGIEKGPAPLARSLSQLSPVAVEPARGEE